MAQINTLYERFLDAKGSDPLGRIAFNTLLRIETVIKEEARATAETESTRKITNEEIDRALREKVGSTLSDLLSELVAQVNSILDVMGNDPDELEDYLVQLKIPFEKVDFQILNPDEQDLDEAEEKRPRKKRELRKNKLRLLVEALRSELIFCDDLSVILGNRRAKAKEGAYACIKIPSIGKVILLNLAHGQATFVMDDQEGDFLQAKKSELVNRFGATRIIFTQTAEEDWKLEVLDALSLHNVEKRSRRQIIIDKIKEKYPRPVSFMILSMDEIRAVRILGRSLSSICTIFDFEAGDVITDSKIVVAKFAQMIYGTGHEVIECELWTLEQWREKFKSRYSTPEAFMKLSQPVRRKIKILGRGLMPLATMFEVADAENIYGNYKVVANFAKAIYGEGHEIIECELWTVEQWIAKIKSVYPSPESFMSVSSREISILGLGLGRLGSKLGVSSDETVDKRDKKYTAMVATRVYGPTHEVILCECWGKKEWAAKIKILYPNGLMRLTREERTKLRIAGKGLTFIGNLFGAREGNILTDSRPLGLLNSIIYHEEMDDEELISEH